MVDYLKNYKTDIVFCKNTELFWKRWFEYHCDDRTLDLQEISYIIKGRIFGEIDGKPVDLGSGDLFWMKPFTPHSLTWQKDLIYFTLRFKLINDKQELTINQPFIQIKNNNEVEQLFRNIVYIINDNTDTPYGKEQIKAYFLLLVAHIVMHNISNPNNTFKREFSTAEKKLIFEYCQNHEFKNIDFSVLSTRLNLSRDYFSRVFKNTFDKSAKVWVFEEKMRFAARQLIDTNLSTNELSELLGYMDVYLFSRQFKKVMGLTPKKYRQKNGIILK